MAPTRIAQSAPTTVSLASLAANTNAAPSTLPGASPETRQLVAALTQINMTNGPLTPEKLALWQQQLQKLTNHGTAVIPAIREFLESKQDTSFESIGGSAAVGQPSMRMALLDATFKLGGPEAIQVLGDTLRSTTEPREIGFLARNLEQQAPGTFTQVAVDSARAAMSEAVSGKLGTSDTAALFYVLQEFGGSAAVPDLLETKRRWPYYSAVALGGLSEGAGIPALVEMARDTSMGTRVNRSAALQVLAQMAGESPEARQALLEQARNANVPTAIWLKVNALLGGEQLRMGPGPDTGLPPVQGPIITSSHLSGGNQNVYTTTVLESLSSEQINQRIQLIDQLLEGNSDTTATEALRRTQTTLSARLKAGAR